MCSGWEKHVRGDACLQPLARPVQMHGDGNGEDDRSRDCRGSEEASNATQSAIPSAAPPTVLLTTAIALEEVK